MSVKTPIVQAKDVMRRNVVAIDCMTTVLEAVAKMRSENVKALIVDKRDPSDAWALLPSLIWCGKSWLPDVPRTMPTSTRL